MSVREILIKTKITPIPNSLEFVEGVMNLRDQIVVVFDLNRKIAPSSYTPKDRKSIILIEVEDILTGLAVDEITGILSVDPDKIELMELLESQANEKFIRGVVRTVEGAIIVLDPYKIAPCDEVLY